MVYQGREGISITVRLEPEVAETLFYASAKRKVSGVAPSTQQDIVGEALTELVNRGLILARRGKGAGTYYKINRRKLKEISALLKRSEGADAPEG